MSELAILWAIGGMLAIVIAMPALQGRSLTVPTLCLALGFALHSAGYAPLGVMNDGLTKLAEAALAIVLFSDAAHLKLARLGKVAAWPGRMLAIGLPLSVALGMLVLWPLFPDMSFWQIGLIAALLTPTDAALGQSLFGNKDVPQDVRDSLLAESGLNDGLALPIIIFFACGAVGFNHEGQQSNWIWFAVQQIGFGTLVGMGCGFLGAVLANWARRSPASLGENTAIFSLFLIALTYFAAEALHGNSFVAVFVAGLCFGQISKGGADDAKAFLETEGMIIMMIAFVFIGCLVLPVGFENTSWSTFLAVIIAIFLVRPAAVWLSLMGSGADRRTMLLLGWFGPRGIATAVFTLLMLEKFGVGLPREAMLSVTAVAIALSAVLHGASAAWAGKLYGQKGANAGVE